MPGTTFMKGRFSETAGASAAVHVHCPAMLRYLWHEKHTAPTAGMGLQAVMQECNEVFEELLGLRSMCWRLGRTWLDCCQHTGQCPACAVVADSVDHYAHVTAIVKQEDFDAHCS